VLAGGELDPTVVVGGRVDAMGSNARLGRSQYLVAEADESDRSFLKLSPVLAVVTNLDREHMDSYKDMADVEACFVTFMDKVPFYGAVTACIDHAMLKAVLPRVTRRVYTYGESAEADFRVRLLPPKEGCHANFEVNARGLVLGPFELHVPGKHNVLNATAAIAIGVQLGIAPEKIAIGLKSFRGVDRRFQTRGIANGVTVIDDYGHHPTEIKATLQAARECGYGRVLVLFQPHRYTRTRDLMDDFAAAFGDADGLQVLDIYAASEEPIPGITGESLAAAVRAQHGGRVMYAASMAEAVERLAADARPGDMVLTLGAGSVSQAGPLLLAALEAKG
jgi:UDP-N-acetylmuramate--alanine ligase